MSARWWIGGKVVDRGYILKSACDAPGIGKFTMKYWVRRLRPERAGSTPKGEALTPEQREIQEQMSGRMKPVAARRGHAGLTWHWSSIFSRKPAGRAISLLPDT